MEVRIVQDKSRGPGHALLAISECEFIDEKSSFSLQRASDQMYLSRDARWLSTVESIPSPDAHYENGTLLISLGPELTRSITETQDMYRLCIGDKEFGTFQVDEEALESVSSGTTGAVGDMPTASATTQPAPQPVPPYVPEPEPQPAPQYGPEPELQPAQPFVPEPAHQPVQPPIQEIEPAGPGQEVELQANVYEPEPSLDMNLQVPPGRKGKGGIIAVALVLCLAVAGAVWWFVLRDGSAPQQPAQPAPQQQAQSQPPARGKLSVNQARTHLRENGDTKMSLDLAKPLRTANATQDEADGAFLLIEDAAQKGEAEAMFLLGQFYDPANTLPHGSIIPDPALARDWYKKASNAQVQGADAALASLRSWLEQKAAAGDREAAQILKDF